MKNSTLKIIDQLICDFPKLENNCEAIKESVKLMIECYKNGGKILICGNGGSAADSEHIVGELMKGFLLKRKLKDNDIDTLCKMFEEDGKYIAENLQRALPAISLASHTALMTAFSNDISADLCFAQQVFGYGNKGDILIAISTSGNSKNIIYAVEVAKFKQMNIVSLTGNKGGGLRCLADILLNVPSDETYRIQEYHLPIYHALCAAVENEFFNE